MAKQFGRLKVRIAIHTDSTHGHPHLRHHILWAAVVTLLFLLLLFSRSVAGEAMVTTSGTIAAAPEHFLGQVVDLPNAEVRHSRSVQVFTLAEDERSISSDIAVVVPMPALDAVQDSERVSVVGTVRIYRVADFERDYLWYRESDFKSDENLLLNRPVIVASSVTTPDGSQLVIR
jgi:hypothetical protein